MDQTERINRVKELICGLLAARQVELVDLMVAYGGGRLQVRCLVDTVRGIKMSDLSDLSRSIGAILDEREVFPEPYVLEVSSPGLDRPLKSCPDFERILGRRIRVLTATNLDGRQEHRGELLSAGQEAIVLRLDSGEKLLIPLTEIRHAVQEVRL